MRQGIRRLTGIKVVHKGGRRYVYRRTPGGLVRLPDLPETDPRFLRAYADAETARPQQRRGAAQGSIAALCAAYLASRAFADLAPSTRAVRRRIVDRIAEQRGVGLVVDLAPKWLRKDLRALSPGAAGNRLKAWRALCAFAVRDGWRDDDPSVGVRLHRYTPRPHREWTRGEIEAYRARWPVGTPERAAMEVMLWTAAACVDAVRLGWQMVDDGWLGFDRQKTGHAATVPVGTLPRWARPMEDDHRHFLAALPGGTMLWLPTRRGGARSVKALSQLVSRAARDARHDGTAHGLRKARASAIAAAGGTPSQIGAWLGDTSLGMAAHYTRQADRRAILGAEQEQNTGNRVVEFPNRSET